MQQYYPYTKTLAKIPRDLKTLYRQRKFQVDEVFANRIIDEPFKLKIKIECKSNDPKKPPVFKKVEMTVIELFELSFFCSKQELELEFLPQLLTGI